MTTLQLVTPPTEAPITLADALAHIRLTSAVTVGSSTDVGGYIDAATALLEGFAQRAFVSRTYDLFVDGPVDGVFELPRQPIVSVTSVNVTDEDDDETEIVAADVYRVTKDGRIVLRRSAAWPYGDDVREVDGYRIRYVAGYGAASAVPAEIKQAIRTQVAEWYENRGDDPEMGVGATATQGVQLALGQPAKAIIEGAGLRRIIL